MPKVPATKVKKPTQSSSKKATPTPKKSVQLSNAPLVEVVFEMKWLLSPRFEEREDDPFNFEDPYYPLVRELFSKEMKKLGYAHSANMVERSAMPFSVPFSIETRFYKQKDQKFPMMQMGMGIFATNAEGKSYEWAAFKAQIIEGVEKVLKCYSQIENKPKIGHLELRYLNFFDPNCLDNKENSSLYNFINNETNAKVSLPAFSFSNKVSPLINGRMTFRGIVTDQKNTDFIIDISDAKKEDISSIKLETKIITSNDAGIPIKIPKNSKNLDVTKDYISKWLEDVREILSPFFDEFIDQKLYNRLK